MKGDTLAHGFGSSFFPTPSSSAFRFTDAIRPAPGVAAAPKDGYRLETYCRRPGQPGIPALAAAVSRERLFEVFLHLLEPLGEDVDVVLETSHARGDGHRDLRRRHIDRPVLESHLCEFEDLLLHDGCTGVAVIAHRRPMEVQFDEHKALICYARDVQPFRDVLAEAGILRNDRLRLVFDEPHVHFSRPDFARRFHDLAWRLGVGAEADMVAG
jgi:hypothetical protein